MKKNIIGHMLATKEPMRVRFRRLHLFPRLLCLLFALIIWLTVVNLSPSKQENPTPEVGTSDSTL